MTVKELIEQLSKFPDELEVLTDGHDGLDMYDIGGVIAYPDDNLDIEPHNAEFVLIVR